MRYPIEFLHARRSICETIDCLHVDGLRPARLEHPSTLLVHAQFSVVSYGKGHRAYSIFFLLLISVP